MLVQEQQENTLTCVLNLCAAFLLQLCVVVPLSVFVLVVQNWVLGSFVCYMLPMIQVRGREGGREGGREERSAAFAIAFTILSDSKFENFRHLSNFPTKAQRELKSDSTN